jgi:hypothetical protein
MDVRVITAAGVQVRPVEELTVLLARDDALVWVDIPDWDAAAVAKSARGAVPVYRPVRFLGPLPEPGVPVGQAPGLSTGPAGFV